MFTNTPLSLYIHIPFCSVKCTYCAFNTYVDLESLIPHYIKALNQEIKQLSHQNPHPALHTIFVGGGTPSMIDVKSYALIFQTIHTFFNVTEDAEITIETNPNDLSIDYLRGLREVGFNRISIGMQSATQKILKLFDRRHDLQMVYDAMSYAREAGFDNINLDVIFGSPEETLDDWKLTVSNLMALNPHHISMYGLELKGGTDLRLKVDSGDLPTPDDDLFADMYDFATDAFDVHGYEQYEISNWSKPGLQAKHNLQYWRNLPYAGIGAGAHGFAGGYRYSTITLPQRYISSLLEGENSEKLDFPLTSAVAKSTKVTPEDDLYETVMMGMRMIREGIDRKLFKTRFGQDFVEMFPDEMRKFQNMGLLHIDENRVHLTESGRLLSNSVIRELV